MVLPAPFEPNKADHLALVDVEVEPVDLDRKLANLEQRLDAALLAHVTTLTDIGGVGTLLVARVLAHTGQVDRFPTEAHYASYAGVAPIEIASGEQTRHRPSRAGNRQLNCALHLITLQQPATTGKMAASTTDRSGQPARRTRRRCDA